MPFPRRALVIAAALASLAAPVASAAPSRPSTGVCHALKSSPALKRSLLRTHLAFLKRNHTPYTATDGPHGRVYYGRCRDSFYALANFGHKIGDGPFDQTDQPERFSRRLGGKWHDRGDTGGDICGAAPADLAKLWGQTCGT